MKNKTFFSSPETFLSGNDCSESALLYRLFVTANKLKKHPFYVEEEEDHPLLPGTDLYFPIEPYFWLSGHDEGSLLLNDLHVLARSGYINLQLSEDDKIFISIPHKGFYFQEMEFSKQYLSDKTNQFYFF